MTQLLMWPDLTHGVAGSCDGLTVTLTRKQGARIWVTVPVETFLAMADEIRQHATNREEGGPLATTADL